ncbi:anti-sigma factor domain-containing protein [Kineococcus arenarius]|uniref:anti-sigma factor domain-containing protein n=1 Tax=Kineococcus sp. SYSU DK007 TaxID=3383128 RepID=UPI003D7DFE6B
MNERDERQQRPGDDEALAGAWALDALDDDERAAYEDRLHREPAERRAADELRETASLLAAAGIGVALDARSDADRARQVAAAQREQQRAAESTLEQVAALLAPGESVTVEATSGGTATVVRSGDRAAVVAAGLPAPAQGHSYQLWLVAGEEMTPAGLLPGPGGDGPSVALLPALGPATGVGLTVEPAGGSQQPTTSPVLVAPLPA